MFWTPQCDDDAIMVALDEADVIMRGLRDDGDCPDCGLVGCDCGQYRCPCGCGANLTVDFCEEGGTIIRH